MKIILIIVFILISSCSTNKVVKNHGTSFIKNKSKDLVVNKSNKNDVLEILGPPSTKSSFDDNIWVYIETKKTSTSIFKLGKRNTEKNNILILQLDDLGLIKTKNSSALIEIDGGVDNTNNVKLKSLGADVLVAGSYIFKSSDINKAISSLK